MKLTRDEYIKAAKASFVSIATRSAMAGLVGAGLPMWASRIVEPLVSFIVKTISDSAEMFVFFKYVDWRVSDQQNIFEKAVAENLKAQQSGNREEIKRAEQNLINAARNFIKLTS